MDHITFVSAYYNIREKEQNPYRNDRDHHFCCTSTYMKALQLLIDHPIQLVIFTDDPTLRDHVQSNSKFPNQHKVIVVPYESLALWPHLGHIILNDHVYHVPNNAVEKFTPLYYLIIHQKLFFIKDVIQNYHFFPKSTHYAWIDVRARALSPITDEFLMGIHKYLQPSKINIPMMMSTTLEEIKDRVEYYKYTRGKIAATFFVGPKAEMLTFHQLFVEELQRSYMAVTEEAIYGVISRTHPSLFYFHYGDYQDTLSNVDGVLHTERSQHLALRAFLNAYSEKNHDLIVSIGRQLNSACCENLLPPQQRIDCIVQVYISSHHLQQWEECLSCVKQLQNGSYLPYLTRPEARDYILQITEWLWKHVDPKEEKQFKSFLQ